MSGRWRSTTQGAWVRLRRSSVPHVRFPQHDSTPFIGRIAA